MAKSVENLWNSLRKNTRKVCGLFYTKNQLGVFMNSFWWNSIYFSQVFQKFCATFLFKNTPVFSNKSGGFAHFPHSLLLLLI